MTIKIKNDTQIAKMKEVGQLAAKVLEYITPYVQPHTTTEELDRLCHEYIVNELNCVPAPLGYEVEGTINPYPKSVCCSVNEVVCHGIPRASEKLRNGSIINIDVTVIHDGFHGDTSKMFFVGNASKNDQAALKLMKTAQECLYLGIEQAKPGNTLADIAKAIQQHADNRNFSVVRDYCGHGIGESFHEAPQVVHYYDFHNPNRDDGYNTEIKPGMTFTIEPMINQGSYKVKKIKEKIAGKEYAWKVVTADGKLSAQWEHTILITNNGNEVLTKRSEEKL